MKKEENMYKKLNDEPHQNFRTNNYKRSYIKRISLLSLSGLVFHKEKRHKAQLTISIAFQNHTIFYKFAYVLFNS